MGEANVGSGLLQEVDTMFSVKSRMHQPFMMTTDMTEKEAHKFVTGSFFMDLFHACTYTLPLCFHYGFAEKRSCKCNKNHWSMCEVAMHPARSANRQALGRLLFV